MHVIIQITKVRSNMGCCKSKPNANRQKKFSKFVPRVWGSKFSTFLRPEEDTASCLYGKLNDATTSESLLKKYLSPDIYKRLLTVRTLSGGSLADCIRSGCDNPDSIIGIYACDPDAYNVFAILFDPIIRDYHNVKTLDHPESNFGDIDNLGFGNLDPSGKFIVSTRVRVSRSHANFDFPPLLDLEHRLEIQRKNKAFLERLEGEHAGKYFPLALLPDEDQEELRENNFLFGEDDRFLRSAGCYKDWPSGRGVFHNEEKTFLVWCNEEEHLSIISMQMGGNLAEVYQRLVKGIKKIEPGLPFAHRKELGYLTFDPCNLGTALKASVHIRIPEFSQTPDFTQFCHKHNIQATLVQEGSGTPTQEESTISNRGLYNISNKRTLGITEIEAIQELRKGVQKCIKREESL